MQQINTSDQNMDQGLTNMELRDVVEDDLPHFFEHQQEPEGNRMAAFPARDREAFMSHWHTKVLSNPEAKKQTVVVDGEVAGHVLSWEQDKHQLVGYWIGKAYWGRGVATRALQEFVEQHVTSRPLHAHVAVRNIGSIRVLEKCGFVQVGEAMTDDEGVEEILMILT